MESLETKNTTERDYMIVCLRHYKKGEDLLFWGKLTKDNEERSYGGYTTIACDAERYTLQELRGSNYDFKMAENTIITNPTAFYERYKKDEDVIVNVDSVWHIIQATHHKKLTDIFNQHKEELVKLIADIFGLDTSDFEAKATDEFLSVESKNLKSKWSVCDKFCKQLLVHFTCAIHRFKDSSTVDGPLYVGLSTDSDLITPTVGFIYFDKDTSKWVFLEGKHRDLDDDVYSDEKKSDKD